MAGIGYPISQPGDIVAAVFSTGDGAPPHWAILLFLECNNSTSGLGTGFTPVNGMMQTATAAVYHVREGARGWVFETVPCVPEIELGGSGSGRWKVLVKIGSIQRIAFQDGSYITPTQALLNRKHRNHLKTLLVPLLQQIPMRVPPEDRIVETRFDCRVWFRAAVRVLRASGLVRCEGVGLLEEECKEYYKEALRRERRGYAGVVRAVSIHGR